jgi:hypothetical protein
MGMTMKDLAKKRGNRAAKLFSKIDDAEFDQLLAAITKEERHRVDPVSEPLSGKEEFYELAWKAITKDKSYSGDPSHDSTDWELASFVDDLWNATLGSRHAQEYKPCW